MSSKYIRIAILVIIDTIIVAFCSIVPLALRFGIFTMDVTYLEPAIKCLPVDILITIGVLAVFRLYNRVWSYAGIDEMLSVFKASLVIEALLYIESLPMWICPEVFTFLTGYFYLYCWQALEFQLESGDSSEESMRKRRASVML